MFIYQLAEALQKSKISFAICGGYAVALHGAARGTFDVDVVLKMNRANFLATENALLSMGLRARLPVTGGDVFDFREEYIKNRNLAAWSFYNPQRPSELVDIIITHDAGKMKIDRIKSEGHVLPIVSKADLIKMKEKSGRPQDLEDVKALKKIKK